MSFTVDDLDAMLDAAKAADGDALSAAELGEWLGLTANRVHALGRDGVLPRTPEKTYPLRESVAAYCVHARSLAKGKQVDPKLAAEKVRLAREQADKLAIANAKARGDMIPAAEVARAWLEVSTELRAAVLAIPSRVAGRCSLDRRSAAALDDEIRLSLEGIADGD